MEWRIFFIGPMGNDPSAKKANDYKNHLPKLCDYLVNHLENARGYAKMEGQEHVLTNGSRVDSVFLKKDDELIIVITPIDLYGPRDIPENVFDAIDEADLIIADLSGNKPAVIYELAFAHALGIETLLVGPPKSRSFYFAQTRIIDIDFQADEISSEDLKRAIDNWLNRRNKLFDSGNPLQKFYGAPLPDISAANGLAASYYDNFVRPILTSGVISENNRAPKGFIVLRPENLSLSLRELEERLEKGLIDRFSKDEFRRGQTESLFIRTDNGHRLPFCVVKDYLIDVPRTIFTLAISPRLQRRHHHNLPGEEMQGVLIGRFFAGLKKYIQNDRNIQEKRKIFHLGSMEEIPSIIETGASNTWP